MKFDPLSIIQASDLEGKGYYVVKSRSVLLAGLWLRVASAHGIFLRVVMRDGKMVALALKCAEDLALLNVKLVKEKKKNDAKHKQTMLANARVQLRQRLPWMRYEIILVLSEMCESGSDSLIEDDLVNQVATRYSLFTRPAQLLVTLFFKAKIKSEKCLISILDAWAHGSERSKVIDPSQLTELDIAENKLKRYICTYFRIEFRRLLYSEYPRISDEAANLIIDLAWERAAKWNNMPGRGLARGRGGILHLNTMVGLCTTQYLGLAEMVWSGKLDIPKMPAQLETLCLLHLPSEDAPVSVAAVPTPAKRLIRKRKNLPR